MISSIAANVRHIREAIQRAADQSGRDPADICLIAATKTVTCEQLEEAYRAQIRHFGENRLQEAQRKMTAFRGRENLNWHFIGRMQRRKLKHLVGNFCLLHSVESVTQAQELDDLAGQAKIRQDVLLEVNVGGEASKGGFAMASLPQVVEELDELVHVRICGLMAIPPWTDNAEDARPYFARLRQLRDSLAQRSFQRIQMKELSMGMSHDYPIAIQEGATFIRIGTEIFGARA